MPKKALLPADLDDSPPHFLPKFLDKFRQAVGNLSSQGYSEATPQLEEQRGSSLPSIHRSMSGRPRYQKLVEFAAHNGDVRCVRIGRKTSGVLATGGDDKKVNVWAIGRTTATLSLQGHTAPVESVTFDRNEEVVAAGAANGSIKTFELQTGKVSRSLSGHKANVSCVEFHPFSSALVSGSMDTNVKHWDLRAKDTTMTLKGHNAPITHAKYTPDGRWVASASQDGAVKIWDLTAGKSLVDLCQANKQEVTGLEYHPFEFLLATSSRDKVIKLWDLETFTCVEQTAPEAAVVRNIAFHKGGKYIFSVLQDGMRVWSWEPAQQHDYVDVPWYRVADLAVTEHRGQQRLIGCSFNSTMVGVFYITLRNVRPFCDDPDFMAREASASTASLDVGASDVGLRVSAQPLPPVGVDNGLRHMNLNARPGAPAAPAMPPPPQQQQQLVPPAARYGGVDPSQLADRGSGGSANGRLAEPLPPVMLPAAPPRYPHVAVPAPNSRYAGAASSSQDFGTQSDAVPGPSGAGGEARNHHPAPRMPDAARPPMVSVGVGVGDSLMRAPPGALPHVAPGPDPHGGPPGGGLPRARSYTDQERLGRGPTFEVHAPAAYPPPQRRAQSPPAAPPPDIQHFRRMSQGPLDAHDHAPEPSGRYPVAAGAARPHAARSASAGAAGGGGVGGYASTSAGASSAEVLRELQQRHSGMRSMLALRSNSLQLIRNFVARSDWRGAIGCARRCNDPGVLPDVLAAMQGRKADAYHLSLVGEIAFVADTVLSMPAEKHVQLALDVVGVQLRAFSQLIQECSAPLRGGVGIDLKFQERREMAEAAKAALQKLLPKLGNIARRVDELGQRAKDLIAQVSQL